MGCWLQLLGHIIYKDSAVVSLFHCVKTYRLIAGASFDNSPSKTAATSFLIMAVSQASLDIAGIVLFVTGNLISGPHGSLAIRTGYGMIQLGVCFLAFHFITQTAFMYRIRKFVKATGSASNHKYNMAGE